MECISVSTKESNCDFFLSGYLLKKGAKPFFKAWKRRWFVVHSKSSSLIHYHALENDQKPLGDIALRHITLITESEPIGEYKYTFIIEEKRRYLLATNTEEERTVWIETIKEVKRKNRDFY